VFPLGQVRKEYLAQISKNGWVWCPGKETRNFIEPAHSR